MVKKSHVHEMLVMFLKKIQQKMRKHKFITILLTGSDDNSCRFVIDGHCTVVRCDRKTTAHLVQAAFHSEGGVVNTAGYLSHCLLHEVRISIVGYFQF